MEGNDDGQDSYKNKLIFKVKMIDSGRTIKINEMLRKNNAEIKAKRIAEEEEAAKDKEVEEDTEDDENVEKEVEKNVVELANEAATMSRIRDCFQVLGTCDELDAFVSIPDEGDMVFLRKKVKSGAAVGKLVLLQVIKAKDLELETRRKLRLRMNFVKTLDFHSSKTILESKKKPAEQPRKKTDKEAKEKEEKKLLKLMTKKGKHVEETEDIVDNMEKDVEDEEANLVEEQASEQAGLTKTVVDESLSEMNKEAKKKKREEQTEKKRKLEQKKKENKIKIVTKRNLMRKNQKIEKVNMEESVEEESEVEKHED
ncbi:hypothetical protein Tco_0916664 [Tanacetum coccineum]